MKRAGQVFLFFSPETKTDSALMTSRKEEAARTYSIAGSPKTQQRPHLSLYNTHPEYRIPSNIYNRESMEMWRDRTRTRARAQRYKRSRGAFGGIVRARVPNSSGHYVVRKIANDPSRVNYKKMAISPQQ